jgi:hypothetical protein
LQLAHVVTNISRRGAVLYPLLAYVVGPNELDRSAFRAARHEGHRLGGLSKPRLA